MACPATRGPGSSRPGASRRSTRCAGARASTPRSATLAAQLEATTREPAIAEDDETVEDDRLRLIFTCCHPALPPDAQVALTLREVCGLTTEEIARAFLTAPPTSRSASCAPRPRFATRAFPTRCRRAPRLPDRLDTVLHVDLSGLQRRLFGVVGRVADAARPVGERRSGSGGSWWSCCRSPKRSACSR